jgi:hypothetical protein
MVVGEKFAIPSRCFWRCRSRAAAVRRGSGLSFAALERCSRGSDWGCTALARRLT